MTDHDIETPPEAAPTIPPLHRFVVSRLHPLRDEVEYIEVLAHSVVSNEAGNVLRFVEYLIDPAEGPGKRIVRHFNGYLDFEEFYPQQSLIVSPHDYVVQ